jgi:intergrase/recombinase
MLRPGFEPGISDSKGVAPQDTRLQIPAVALSSPSSLTTNSMDWDKYKEYLYANQRPNTARLALKYGEKYSYVLERMDIKDLLVLQPAKQRHVMKALANLAKYNGIYEEWNNLRRQHQLKWSSTNTLDVFERIMNNGTDYNKMLDYVKQILAVLPRSHANVIMVATLTGLRPVEACKSVRLIHTDLSDYLNPDLFILEHFKWKDVFIRRTKKSFISVMTDRLLQIAKSADPQSYTSIYAYLHKRSLLMRMNYCRKIFGTHLRYCGIESEMVNLLEGRISPEIFVRHYWSPNMKQDIERVRKAIDRLADQLI